MPRRALAVGDLVGLTGDDEPALVVWRAHPGVVIHVALGEHDPPWDVTVDLVGGPCVSGLPSFVEDISGPEFQTGGVRVVAGLHPLEDRPIEPHTSAPGHEWPTRPR